jgi:prepilin-type N-terminal cleavage/methylation domain-containing protein
MIRKEQLMNKNREGFTLLEMVIVVTIIALLLWTVAPRYFESVQEAKQTMTMKDIGVLADACYKYILDNDEAPPQAGPLTPNNPFVKAIASKYLTECPLTDKWKNPLVIYTGLEAARQLGISSDKARKEDFLIISYGHDNKPDEGFQFNPENPDAGRYKVANKDDFNNDIINFNRLWIRAPLK